MRTPPTASRRIVFQGLGALGVAVALAGCGGGDPAGTAAPTGGTELATTDEIPVGGGVINADAQVVVTQPTAGEYVAFTAVCTHQGNLVTSVADGTIECSHHGSSFDAATGEPTGGPAPSPLAEIAIEVDGDVIRAA